eukprot:TRINITY_DN109320_c0_g1_i1.p1 TRINITY_DN109320_c0_g1~~TRINITY_DN109320_c0_g1_i1.p1  ORF type:complete len:350 (+),score=83.11 TRINITY_DN109320_c0_g1_i1:1-1050(+)
MIEHRTEKLSAEGAKRAHTSDSSGHSENAAALPGQKSIATPARQSQNKASVQISKGQPAIASALKPAACPSKPKQSLTDMVQAMKEGRLARRAGVKSGSAVSATLLSGSMSAASMPSEAVAQAASGGEGVADGAGVAWNATELPEGTSDETMIQCSSAVDEPSQSGLDARDADLETTLDVEVQDEDKTLPAVTGLTSAPVTPTVPTKTLPAVNSAAAAEPVAPRQAETLVTIWQDVDPADAILQKLVAAGKDGGRVKRALEDAQKLPTEALATPSGAQLYAQVGRLSMNSERLDIRRLALALRRKWRADVSACADAPVANTAISSQANPAATSVAAASAITASSSEPAV